MEAEGSRTVPKGEERVEVRRRRARKIGRIKHNYAKANHKREKEGIGSVMKNEGRRLDWVLTGRRRIEWAWVPLG